MRALVKVLRDLWVTRGRVAFMVLSLAAGLISLGTVLSARGVLQREMNRNYMETVPASATFDVGEQGLDDTTFEALKRHPQVAQAARRTTRSARWRKPGTTPWGRATLFVFEDFEHQVLAKLNDESGLTVPPPGTILVERSAMGVLDANVGDAVEVTTAHGSPVTLQIVGVVHEPALAPAVTEQAGYFYASVQTLALLGEQTGLDEVRVLVADDALDATAVQAQVEVIAQWLVQRGVALHEVRVPPPGKHPHQAASEVVLLMFSIFAGLTVVLAAVLCASLLSITMARQVREIAVMKTLGATKGKIRRMYALMLGIIAVLALAVSAVPTRVLGRLAVDGIAALINFDIASYEVPLWVYAIQISIGLLLPLLAAAPAIVGASRVSVLRALNEHGARVARPGLERWVGGRSNRVLQAALRNALRVPKRLLLTVTLLGVGGGLFVSAWSVADAWDAMTDQVFETRHYDVEVRLSDPVSQSLLDAIQDMPRVEVWGFASVALTSASGVPLNHTYPDGGHGSFALTAVPDDTQLVDFAVRSGRWLNPGEVDGVVLNQLAASRIGDDPLGKRVKMLVEGVPTEWTVVGVVDEVASPAAAYVGATAFSEQTGQPLAALRIATGTNRDPQATRQAIARVEQTLASQDAHIASVLPLELLFNAMGAHVVVLIRSLLGLALLMAVVSTLALSSSMSTSVVERTREFGILRAIGARPRQIRRMVLIEGIFTAVLSLPLALLLAVPLAATIGRVVGLLSFGIALPLDIAWLAMAGWSVGVVVVATVASLAPAYGATKRSVTEALGHV
ncbi:MAG: FtsX-like permease family protein [Nannocystaceae bacterium]|nr:FtsX-like permease family protein [Nannocystaceae bacterium]